VNKRSRSLEVCVEFYDENEKKKLQAYPLANRIGEVVSKPINIPYAEFLTYYLFHRKRPELSGISSYAQLGGKIDTARKMLEDFVKRSDHSLFVPKGIIELPIYVSENIGESVGLSVINRIHGLSEADWNRIPVSRGVGARPVFDYEHLASDGKSIIQLEAKGSCVKTNVKKTSSISNHKSDILKKKSAIRLEERRKNYNHPAQVRYGTITSIDRKKDGIIKCRLVDPAPLPFNFNPKILRILNRLIFLRDWISFIMPRSQLSIALANRIVSLERIEDVFKFEDEPLVDGKGKRIGYRENIFFTPGSNWFSFKSQVADGPFGGLVIPSRQGGVYFLGLDILQLDNVAKQNYEKILSYIKEARTVYKRVNCLIPRGKIHEFNIPENLVSLKNQYISFQLSGNLQFSPEGTVFGFLPFDTAS